MLIKSYLKQIGLKSLSYLEKAFQLYSTKQKKIELQSTRNRDYKSQRVKLIELYNDLLIKERQKFSKQILSIKTDKSTQKFIDEFYGETHDQFSNKAQNYKDKIDVLSKKLKKDLYQIDLEQKTNTVKIYLTDHLKQEQQSTNFVNNNSNFQTGGFYIPNRFILKKLYLCNQKQAKNTKPEQQLLLAGVESEQEHCLFLNKLFNQFSIKNVVTMIPPDLPFFLKTQDSFVEEWRKFLQDGKYAQKVKFYVNPKPKTLDQIVLHSHYAPYVRASLARSKAFLDTHYYLMQQNDLTGDYQPLPLMTGICNQNVSKNYMADYPVFQQRKMLANNISLNKLRQLFQLHLKNIRENRLNFSAQWLFPKQVLKKKLSHLLGVARAVTETSEGRTILICPAEIAQLLSIQWQIGKKQNKLRFSYQDSKHYLYFGQTDQKEGEQTFIQFVQKLVILDVIMDKPVITNYFVKYKSFPFLCHHTIGGKENIGKIFIIWMHFYKTYYEALTEKRLYVGKDAEKRAQYLSKFQDPQDFH